jgi:hypothetical protein
MKQIIISMLPKPLQTYAEAAFGDLHFNLKCTLEFILINSGSIAFSGAAKLVMLDISFTYYFNEIFHSAMTIITGIVLAAVVYFGNKVYFPYLVGRYKDKNPKYKLYDNKEKE